MTMSGVHMKGTTPVGSPWLARLEPAAAILLEKAKVVPATSGPLYRPSERHLCHCFYGVCCSEGGAQVASWGGVGRYPGTQHPHMWVSAVGLTPTCGA